MRRACQDYLADDMLRAAVERKLQNAGEAMSQARQHGPDLAARVPEYRQVIAFRNVLVHNYEALDHNVVWNVLEHDAPPLVGAVKNLLAELDAAKEGE